MGAGRGALGGLEWVLGSVVWRIAPILCRQRDALRLVLCGNRGCALAAGDQIAGAAFAVAALQANLQIKLNFIKAFAALRLGDDAAVRYAMADTNDHEWAPKHRMGSGWCDSKCKLLSIQLVGVNLGQKKPLGASGIRAG